MMTGRPAPPDPHRTFSAYSDTLNDRVDARGDLDSFTVEHLRGVMEILLGQGHNCITLDCKGLLTIDPPGIELLVAMRSSELAATCGW